MYTGMLSIGIRPATDDGLNRMIKMNTLHFHPDIYDEFVRLTFAKRARPELRFSSINELVTQLYEGVEETETILRK